MTPHDDQKDEEAGPADGVDNEDVLTVEGTARLSAGPYPLPARPRLKRTLERLVSCSGDIYLLRTGADSDLVLEQPDQATRRLLDALDGTRPAAVLAREFGAPALRRACAALSDAHLLEDAADDDLIPLAERLRFERQHRYFADIGDDRPSVYQARLREARLVILGVGGLGSWAAYALACCGVGELLLVDGDTVEASNFNRQILYRESDIGRSKVVAAAEALGQFNSSCTIRGLDSRLDGPQAVREAVSGHDFVVSSADWPAHDIERWVNQACCEEGVPFISMSHAPPVARVGPLYVPGITGCFECQEAGYRLSYPEYDDLIEQRRGRASPAATLGPVCAFVGGQVALEAVHQITGLCRPATLGGSYVYDLRSMDVIREEVPRRPGCPICADAGAAET